MSIEPLRITFRKPEFTIKEHNVARKEVWHKFIIFDAVKYDKSLVIDTIIAACEPDVILPYMCKTDDEGKLTFIAKCNVKAVQKLVAMYGLRLQIFPNEQIGFDVVLGFLMLHEIKYSPQFLINNTLTGRYNATKRILNFDNFQKDESLGSLYCPLGLPRVLDYILHHTKNRFKEHRDAKLIIHKFSLRSNNLKQIYFSEKHFGASLSALDLRDNELADITSLMKYFSEFKISELWLDGNPLCDEYKTAEEYVGAVKGAFPHLRRLDGVTVTLNKKNIPYAQPCFLGNGTRTNLIKQFVVHFFTLYDQEDRGAVLTGLYDDDQAVFSMTVGMLGSHAHKRMTQSWAMNRNLLKFVDYSKCHEYLLLGSERIIAFLRQQPRTCHDVNLLHVDLLHSGDYHFVISVQGHFGYRDSNVSPMYFCRTFVISARGESEYCITNDQYHVVGAATDAKDLVKFPKTPKFVPASLSVSERQQLSDFLHKLSNMNEKYCRKFLEDAGWDIRLAISNFTKAYMVNNIDPEAYRSLHSKDYVMKIL